MQFLLALVLIYHTTIALGQWVTVEELNFLDGNVGRWRLGNGAIPPLPAGVPCRGTPQGDLRPLGMSVYGQPRGTGMQWLPYSYPGYNIKHFRITGVLAGIDSWDSEHYTIYYNGNFLYRVFPQHTGGRPNYCANNGWSDQFIPFDIVYPPLANPGVAGPFPSIGFTVNTGLNQGVDDESYAIGRWNVYVIPNCAPCTDNGNQQCNGAAQASCSNTGTCQRTCTCNAGYSGTTQLSNNAVFPGCTLINYCTQFNNQQCNGDPFATCSASAPFTRQCTCPTGYVGTATLQNNQGFGGCVAISGCTTYGPSGSSGNPANVIGCIDGYNQRTVTCAAGYYAVAPANPSITLIGNARFPGCTQIDMCAVYGYSNNGANAQSCTSGVNQRTITCKPGYWAVAPDVASVTLVGNAAFGGCNLIDNCALYGFSGNSGNTQSCTSGVNTRTITCNAGYFAVAPATASITLTGNAAFGGCRDISECSVYGANPNPANTLSCTENGINQRTITCNAGYFATAPSNPSVTLFGGATFGGCKAIDMCAVYGFSGQPANTLNCVNTAINQRTITCASGYFAVGSDGQTSITLTGTTAFSGCRIRSPCTVLGFSGRAANTLSCVDNSDTVRTITCQPGYYAVAPSTASVSLTSPAEFMGCTEINECTLYLYSGNGANAASCTDGVNRRTITCNAGYAAVAPATASVTLIGDTAFNGCFDIDECTAYAYSGKATNAVSCQTLSINTRTITCAAGYWAVAPSNPTITLTGAATFAGCNLIDNCDVYGYSGKPQDAVSCTSGVNTRTITCAEGFYAVAPTTRTIQLTGNAAFAGCMPVDECTVYGSSGITANVASCTDGRNQRTITCNAGYYAVAPATRSITLTGGAAFLGCTEINECTVYGNSGNGANVASCTNGVNQRTITCNAGYYAVAPATASITLTANAAFGGCFDINECSVYRYSGNAENAISCTQPAINQRTVTCAAGYYAIAPATASITLTGNATFAGCKLIDLCAVSGPTNGQGNVESCVNNAPNQRNITCATGYAPVGGNGGRWVVLTGNTAFGGCKVSSPCTVFGFSGANANTLSCVDVSATQRTITCKTGYYAVFPDKPSVTLDNDQIFIGCREIDNCGAYGYSGKDANTLSCTNGPNTRTITCKPGYFATAPATATVTLTGAADFLGCKDIQECTVYGYSGNSGNAASCTETGGVNTRTITCNAGYYAVAPSTASITLTGNAMFNGCKAIDNCAVYGYSNNAANTLSCTSGINTRTITCAAGYFATAPATATITLTGNAAFAGCKDIDECTVYSFSGKADNTLSCTNSAVNERTVTCKAGYRAIAPDVNKVVLKGSASFLGCTEIDECAVYGYNGNSANTAGCVQGVNTRTITCNEGYFAVAPTTRSITLTGSATFPGCRDIQECAVYGANGKPNTASCTEPAINQRTVTCAAGYYAIAPSTAGVTLTGNATFGGCTPIDMCTVYGFSGNNANTVGCANTGINQRTITCATGYSPVGGATGGDTQTIVLTGTTAFAGCRVRSPCTVYGFSGKPDNTLSCTDATTTSRLITCKAGFYAVAPANPSITLNDGQNFQGCMNINECEVYGNSGKGTNVASCQEGVNQRTMTCAAGYYAVAPATPTVVLTGNATFQGCTDIDECVVYGFSNNAANTANCKTNAVNQRTITCNAGYFAVAPDTNFITLTGSNSFAGCRLIDTCAVYGYSGQTSRATGCVSAVNSRTITCDTGFYAVAPATPTITLTGNAVFTGCKQIDNCVAYGYSNKANNTQGCVSGLNTRTITCKPGYNAGNNQTTIILTGNAAFPGCFDTDECALFGYSGKNNNSATCVQGINWRVLSCAPGYYAVAPDVPSVNLTGSATFAGCTEINECSVYRFSGKSTHTFSCTDGLNQRTITCENGARPMANGTILPTNSITLVGKTNFSGCAPICGDGIVLRPEENCDDKDVSEGDGCSATCRREPGYICGEAGLACCKLLGRTIDTDGEDDGEDNEINDSGSILNNLYCYDGFWRTSTKNGEKSTISGTVTVEEDVELCGDFVVPSDSHLIIDAVTLTIAGSISAEGTIELTNGGKIVITPPCYYDDDSKKRADTQFGVVQGGTLAITHFVWNDDEAAPDAPFVIEGCIEVKGTLIFQADEIPHGSNTFTLIHSDAGCVDVDNEDDVFEEIEMDLPDGCSNLDPEVEGDEDVTITLNRKTLCPAQIGGIAVGCFFTTVLVGGGAVAASGAVGGASAANDAYVLL